MTDSLQFHLSRYCFHCGAPLTFTNITTNAGHGEASWICSGCGHQSGSSWEEFSFSPGEEEMSPSPDSPPPSILPDEANEASTQSEALRQAVDARGVAAIVEAAPFPLFALCETQKRFLPQGYGWGGNGWSSEWPKEKLSRPLTWFNLCYGGPSYKEIVERLIIDQEDPEANQRWSGISNEEQPPFDPHHVVSFLADLPEPDMPSLHSLWENRGIYQFINVETVSRAPVINSPVELQSGEAVSWAIRRFKAPLPIAHAEAKIEGTRMEVGVIGPAAEDLEQVLAQLTRLMPKSASLKRLSKGHKAWMKHVSRRFWRSR